MLTVGAAPAAADTLNLAWNANAETTVIGYIMHVGTQPGTYTQHIDVGLTTSYSYPNAVAGQQYCFALSAYVAGPLEGLKSSEVCGYSNRLPVLVNPGSRSSTLSQSTSLQLQGSDPDGQPVTYSATGLPAGLTLMASTGYVTGTPTTAGTYSVTATVFDGVLSASQTFTWTIVAPDVTAPVVTITGPTSSSTHTTSSSSMTLSGTASDNVNVTQVTWTNNRGGSGTATGTTTWSVASIALLGGSNVITVTARDAAGNTTADVLTVTYNSAPTLASVANQSTEVGRAAALQLASSDTDGDILTYGAMGLPPGLAISVSSGLISGTPTDAGTFSVTATVLDGTQSSSRTFTWTITPDATAPTIAIVAPTSASTLVTTTPAVVLSGTAADAVGVTQLSWANNRGGSGVASGTASWGTPSISLLPGANVITVTALDAAGNAAGAVLTVTYNTPPTLAAVADRVNTVGQAVSVQLVGSDADGDALTYTAVGLPPGVALSPTGVISGTLTTAGVFTITASVTSGGQSASLAFTWTVKPLNVAPTIAAIATQSSRVGQYDVLQLVASDANGDVLSFSAAGLPPGFSFDPSTGLIEGVAASKGSFTVTVSVSDGSLIATRTFTWTVKRRF